MSYYTDYDIHTCKVADNSQALMKKAAAAHAETLLSVAFMLLPHKEQQHWLSIVRKDFVDKDPIEAYLPSMRHKLEDMQGSYPWYSYQDDTEKISAAHPGWLITIYGRGEDRNDNWVHYFYDGKSEKFNVSLDYPGTTLVKNISPGSQMD